MQKALISQAREEASSWPLAELTRNGVHLDRVDDNPEAARYFLAYSDWGKISPEDIFAEFEPPTAGHTQIYVDFPYCPTICNFCAFYGSYAKTTDEHVRYISSLKKEVDLLAQSYFRPGVVAETLELGGGTPTFTPLPLLREFVEHLLATFPFAKGKEHNFEATPESIIGDEGFAKLEYLRNAGFGRMSIGAQTFNDEILKKINRPHGTQEIVEALKCAQSLDFSRINFDLIIGLVDQTLEDFFESVERSVDLGVEVIEIYTMRYFDTKKHVPATVRLRQASRFLDPETILVGRLAADRYLRSVGYSSSNGRTYQLDQNTFYAEHYQENFRGNNVLGVGRKSHSNVYPWQYANYRNIEKYHAHLDEGRLPVAAGCRFDERARVGKLVTGALQLPVAFDYHAMKAQFPKADTSDLDDRMKVYERLGLIESDRNEYTTTRFGFFFIEEMLKGVFDTTVTPFNSDTEFLGKTA